MPKTIEEISGEELCSYCYWERSGYTNNSMGMCEGRWCSEAYETYLEELEESEE